MYVCYWHGAGTPSGKVKAAQRLSEHHAEYLLDCIGDPAEPIDDPTLALESLGGRALKLVEVLARVVSRLEEMRYQSGQGLEQVRGELTVYMTALQRAESIVVNILKQDLDNRRVRLEEEKVIFVADALERAFASPKVGMTDSQKRAFRKVLMTELSPAVRTRPPPPIPPAAITVEASPAAPR
jgi:hypothetical protein